MTRIIDNRKVVAQYDDLHTGSTVRFYLVGNDNLSTSDSEPWAVLKYRRTTYGEVKVSTTYFAHQNHALTFFAEMIKTFSKGLGVLEVNRGAQVSSTITSGGLPLRMPALTPDPSSRPTSSDRPHA